MDATPKRPWYRLHWGTVLTVFFVGIGWATHVLSNTIYVLRFYREEYPFEPDADGWPIVAIFLYPRIVVRPAALI